MPQPPDTSHLIQCYARQEVMFVRGEGCYLTDDRGRRYLDAFAGVAVSALGHGHPALAEAICRQARSLLHVSNHYFIEGQEELARKLVGHAFPSRVFFCNSGAEANEGAYKLVRLWGNVAHGGRKRRILAFEGSFHGRTIGALSLTANPGYREPFEPLPAAEFLPFGDQSAFQKAMGDDVAGVFLEPIQGEGGVRVPPPGFLKAVRDACTRHGALLVADEVQTGMGRTGRFFGHQHEGTVPDVMSLAKGIAGGLPLGALLAKDRVAKVFTPGTHASTFGGNPVTTAAASAVVDLLEGGLLDHVRRVAEVLQARLAALPPTTPRASGERGLGLLRGVLLGEDIAPKVVAKARELGLLVNAIGDRVLRLAPPLTVSEREIQEASALLAHAIAQA